MNQTKPNQTKCKQVKAKSFGTFLLVFIMSLAFTNCQVEEEILQQEQQINTIYKEATNTYFKELKLNSATNRDKIEELITAIDLNTLKMYSLASSQKILTVDVNTLQNFENTTKIKTVFFLIDDKIVQSRIVAFNNTTAFNDYDTLIVATLNRTSKEKLQYSGLITFYNAFQNKLLANEYSKGLRIQSGALNTKSKKSITAKTNGCTDWYWVTNYADGRQTNEYLYTTCNDCEEMAYKTLNGCGGGGGGGGQTNSIFPASPIDNAIVNYFSPEGEHIKYQYINGIWKIILISLPDIVIKTVRESRPYLIFDWPQDKQKVVAEGFVYTYDSESGNWEGVPIDDLKIINELTGKAKCLNDLLDKDGDSSVQNLLANFEGESEFDIKIISKDKVFSTQTGLEVNGHTLPPINNVIVIEISTSRINDNAALEGARVILHEYIHADIFRKLNTLYNTSGTTDFKKMYEVYENQHGTMAELYLNSMKEALKEFHKNVLTDDYNKYINYYGEAPNDAFYEALAWGGLRDNDVKAWVDLPAEKKIAIEALANRAILLSKTVPCPN